MASKRLVHLQCHVGLDTLSWARNGALVTGLDMTRWAQVVTALAGAGLRIDFLHEHDFDTFQRYGQVH